MATINHHQTCPYIDRGISEFKSNIEDTLSNVLDDCCPLLEGKQKEDFIKSYSNQLYGSLEDIFEKVRETNYDLRRTAERQLEDLESEINEKYELIMSLQDNISDLEHELTTNQD